MRTSTSILLFTLLSLSLVNAYDTGHHSDLTRNALDIFGYNTNAQTTGSICNWFVDYYSYTVGFEDIPDLAALHYDNLFTLSNVSHYMSALVRNTRNAVRVAVQNRDPLRFLCVIGASLHAVQDFYTHSSWAENHATSCGCYRDDTWFSVVSQFSGNLTDLQRNFQSLRTYSWGEGCNEFERNCLPGQLEHGEYCDGINKDSYVRPGFERGYSHAMAGTIEWIYNIQKWGQEFDNGTTTIIDQAKNYTPSSSDLEDLNKNYKSSIYVSYAVKSHNSDDGHYKGPGSGSIKRFVGATISFFRSSSTYKRLFSDLRFWNDLTSPNPYDVAATAPKIEVADAIELVTPFTEIPPQFTDLRKIKIRTTYAKIQKTGANTPSPYAKIYIDGMEFIEAVQIDKEEVYPHWTTIKYVPATTTSVSVVYELLNDKFPDSDEMASISTTSQDGKLHFNFDLATQSVSGDVTGSYNSKTNVLTSSSGGNRNSVQLYVTEELFGNCLSNGRVIEDFCQNEAYTEYLLHEVCGFVADSSAVTFIPISILSVISFFFFFF